MLLACVFAPAPLHAQDTREALLEQQRAERAKALEPYRPGKLEKWLLWFEDVDPLGRLSPHDGFYLQYGFKWKPVGGGIGLGGGWRHDLFHRNARLVLGGGVSTRGYNMLQADFSFPYSSTTGSSWAPSRCAGTIRKKISGALGWTPSTRIASAISSTTRSSKASDRSTAAVAQHRHAIRVLERLDRPRHGQAFPIDPGSLHRRNRAGSRGPTRFWLRRGLRDGGLSRSRGQRSRRRLL